MKIDWNEDRIDITGARWGLNGAEAILKLRSLRSSGDFDAYSAMRPQRVAKVQPDVLLCHIQRLDASAMKKRATLRGAAIRVLVSTRDHVTEPLAAEALEHNILHVALTRTAPIETYLKAVRAVAAGELWRSRRVIQGMIYKARAGSRSIPPNAAKPRGLTAREHEIRGFIITGMSNKEIGQRFGISGMTVKTHLRNLMQKLQVRRRVQLFLRLRGQDRRAIDPAMGDELTGFRR